MNEYDVILEFISEIQNALTELLSSGFNAVHDYTKEELKRLKIDAESYNLHYAAQVLAFLYEKLYEKRHNFEFDYSECIEQFCKLNEYCMICKEQLEIEKVKL